MKRIILSIAALPIACSMTVFAAETAVPEVKAEVIVNERCAACHGVDGNSVDANNPRLAGQWRDYLAKALRDYKSGARNNGIMSGFAKGLSDKDIENLAAYYAAQKPVLNAKY